MAELSLDGFRELTRNIRPKCKECGWAGHSLVDHLKTQHKLSPGQYQAKWPREKYPDAKLASPLVAELLKKMNRNAITDIDLRVVVGGFKSLTGGTTDEQFAQALGILNTVDALAVPDAIVPVSDPFYSMESTNARIYLAALVSGMNTYISGPTGCGKTEFVYQVMAKLGSRAFVRLNMNGDVTRDNFLGGMRADPTKGTFFKKGAMPICMRAGCPVLVDEVDYTPPQIAAVMNSLLEGKRTLHLEEIDERITAAPGFSVTSTANTGGKGDSSGVYNGTEVLNSAFLDRYGVHIRMDYLKPDVEVPMLLRRFPNANADTVRLLVKSAGEVRNAFKMGTIGATFSTRKLIDTLTLQPQLTNLAETLNVTFFNWLDEDDKNLVVELMIRCGFTKGSLGVA